MKTTFGFILYLLVFILLISCGPNEKAGNINTTPLLMADSLPGSCPHLAKDKNGNIVLSWIRNTTDSSYIFCFAISKDNGIHFLPAINIPGSTNIHPHAENIPKILVKPSGEMLAIWGAANPDPGNPYAGLIFYTQSFDDGRSWTPVQPLVKDTAGYDQRYFDVTVLDNGEAAIIWLDNRKSTNKAGSALYFAVTNGQKGFEQERLIAEPCCECCRVALLEDHKKIHVLYRAIIEDSIRDMVHAVSVDGGKSFSSPRKISKDDWVINTCPHSGPAMTADGNGVAFAWFTGGNPGGVFFTQTADDGNSFSTRDSVNRRARHPQIIQLENQGLAIAFDEPSEKENSSFYRIGIEKRVDGKRSFQQYVTADSMVATYPVMIPVSGQLLLAFVTRKNDRSFIAYERITLK